MPRDPKRSAQSYQLQGGNLNEFEFQKSQGEMAEESKPAIPIDTDYSNVSQSERVAEVTSEAHKKVEKRRKLGATQALERRGAAAGKKSVKKTATRSARKTSKSAGPKKRASVKTRRQKLATS